MKQLSAKKLRSLIKEEMETDKGELVDDIKTALRVIKNQYLEPPGDIRDSDELTTAYEQGYTDALQKVMFELDQFARMLG